MGSCYLGDHTAADHIQTDIKICNILEPQKTYHFGTVNYRLLGARV